MNSWEVIGWISLVLLQLVIAFLLFRKNTSQLKQLTTALVPTLSQALTQETQNQLQTVVQRPMLDLTERITRMGSETRETLAERLGKHFLESQERSERTMAQGRSELQNGLIKTTQALELKFQSLEQQVGLRLETIGKNVESKLNENIKEGFKQFEKVQAHLASAELKLANLSVVGQSISDLNSLLKLPHLRGGFGEATLERLLTDFLPPGGFEMQYCIDNSTTERVDAVVKLAKQVLPIDSKFPREAILPLFESQAEGALELARKALGDFVRTQAKSIAKKYIRPEHGTTDMALLFLPSETVYFEVIRNGKLFEEISNLKVFPISPNTLAIGLRSVVMAQDYYDMARGVEKTIEDVKMARRHFDHFGKRFEDLGKNLRKAQEAYDVAGKHLGHYETSVYRLVGDSADLAEIAAGGGAAAAGPRRSVGKRRWG